MYYWLKLIACLAKYQVSISVTAHFSVWDIVLASCTDKVGLCGNDHLEAKIEIPRENYLIRFFLLEILLALFWDWCE